MLASHSVFTGLRRSKLGDSLDDLAAYLCERGNASVTVREYVAASRHSSDWLRQERIALSSLTEATVRRFLQQHVPGCRCSLPCGKTLCSLRPAPTQLLVVLRRAKRIAPAEPPEPRATDALIRPVEAHLREVRGAAPGTCGQYTRYAREFLEAAGAPDERGLKAVDVRHVMGFIANRAAHCKPGTAKDVATALRSFLRFEQMRGVCAASSAKAVPTVPRWRLSRLPKALSDEQVRALLSSFDRSTGIGRRDYAITLCLVRLALRAGEVAALSLDDIDWHVGTIEDSVHVPRGTSARMKMGAEREPVREGRGRISMARNARGIEICCGLDVHAKSVVACLNRRGRKEVRTFGTMTGQLLELRDWLVGSGCPEVAMEATGSTGSPCSTSWRGPLT